MTEEELRATRRVGQIREWYGDGSKPSRGGYLVLLGDCELLAACCLRLAAELEILRKEAAS